MEDFLCWLVVRAFGDQGKDSGFWQLSWVSPASHLLQASNPICHPVTQSHPWGLNLPPTGEVRRKGEGKKHEVGEELEDPFRDKGFLVMQLWGQDCRGRTYLLFLRETYLLHSLSILSVSWLSQLEQWLGKQNKWSGTMILCCCIFLCTVWSKCSMELNYCFFLAANQDLRCSHAYNYFFVICMVNCVF